jgi:hypothetical protein
MSYKSAVLIIMMFSPLISFSQTAEANEQMRLKELDAYWAEVTRAVYEGDFEGYSATCHPKGTLVWGVGKKAYPISQALAGWESDFVDTKSGIRKSQVEFRFSQRLGEGDAAHETGIFHYTFKKGDKNADDYINFEALLVKDGTWKIMMEYQKSYATKEDWDKLETK